jgi:hypothetical protein
VAKATWGLFARYLLRMQEMRNFATNLGLARGTRVTNLLTMLKNDFMNLILGYKISFDCCCRHHMNANELWLCMIALVIISE